jgi:hypothetical protein
MLAFSAQHSDFFSPTAPGLAVSVLLLLQPVSVQARAHTATKDRNDFMIVDPQ